MDRIEKEEANASADNSTEGDIILANNGSNFEEEEEKIEEDVIADRLTETQPRQAAAAAVSLKRPKMDTMVVTTHPMCMRRRNNLRIKIMRRPQM